jgi:hypothetical protein
VIRLLLPPLLLGAVAGCGAARPTAQSLAAEPVLEPLPGEVELGDVRVQPRRSRIGVPGRNGVVERIIAVDLSPAEAADLVQQRHGARYSFRRVDLGGGTPVTVELRGSAPTGAEVIVTSSSAAPVPLYGGAGELRPLPPNLGTTVVITVVSPQ